MTDAGLLFVCVRTDRRETLVEVDLELHAIIFIPFGRIAFRHSSIRDRQLVKSNNSALRSRNRVVYYRVNRACVSRSVHVERIQISGSRYASGRARPAQM